ncbi:MAG: hypothetical protein CFK52_04790 [Chloracidobacterium sp. CP2_5A]|nr:MAG: hypothetical protein CFK52_04790 [Chloracidobacterium sp. CP2_5A]
MIQKVDVILWSREVELRGLPRALEAEYEARGAFWVTRGLRLTRSLFELLEIERPELEFRKYEVPPPPSAGESASGAAEEASV